MPDLEEMQNKRAFTIKEAAEYACVSRGTLENWISKGLLPFEELPGRGTGTYCFKRIRKEDIDTLLSRYYRRNKPNPKKELRDELILLPRNS